jgi:hypothetical protein
MGMEYKTEDDQEQKEGAVLISGWMSTDREPVLLRGGVLR